MKPTIKRIGKGIYQFDGEFKLDTTYIITQSGEEEPKIEEKDGKE